MWVKLESLYMTKFFAHKLYLNQQFYLIRTTESRIVVKQLANYNNILNDLEKIEMRLKDDDKALVLLNTLPKAYEHLKNALLLGKE